MLLPFHVWCVEPSVPLFRLADGRFQLTKDGPIAPFMSGPGYFVVERNLARFLSDLDISRIRFEPAVIWHRRLDLEYSTHASLLVDQHITPETLGASDLSEERIYSMNDTHLFVSPALKDRLESSSFRYLRFSEGLADFAS